MTNVDSQRIKEIRDNTAKMADAFTCIADALERLADRKTEPQISRENTRDSRESHEKADRRTEPTISKMEQVDEPQTCDTCKYGEDKHRYAHICNECGVGINNYEPKDESFDKDINVHSKNEP